MARIASFVVLVVILLLIGGLFIRVMLDFILPLFLAVLLVIVFGPMHRTIQRRCRGRNQLAAALSTAIILLAVLLPMTLVIVQATAQAIRIAQQTQAGSAKPALEGEAAAPLAEDVEKQQIQFDPRGIGQFISDAVANVGIELSPKEVQETITTRLEALVAPVALGTSQWLLRLLIGFVVMSLALYYFLADGPEILRTLMRLSPLDDAYEQQIVAQFDQLTRTIVVATLVAAIVQGILAGIGYYVAGVGSIVLLTVVTALMAMVPFLGATAVWLPVCAYLYFAQDRPGAAIGLAIYSALVVSTSDNVIKPLILHGGAKLHPLLALMSVLGGVKALGPVGIFVGPMAVAFLQTLLVMVNAELVRFGQSTGDHKLAPPGASSAKAAV